ncbi:hypothetical protein [Methylomonas fluvii]|uniref:ABC transporter permease n=1 Tax=Methylomonas fluvii TaxID=1854564 RepID=A0ABR9DCR0_9GAMM|nr:hypothetical protein [Methylomonas fluvii]MBD9360884.1 hypothetical protein [Methylomonas fluvii]CAD6873756.1 hypothetical protein [Methylomonas fluvii]
MTFKSLVDALIKNKKYIGLNLLFWVLMAFILLEVMPIKYEAQIIIKLGQFDSNTPIAGAAESIEYLRNSETLIAVATANNVSPNKLSKRIRTHPIDNNKAIKILVHWDSVDDAERLVSALGQKIVDYQQQKLNKELNSVKNEILYWEKILDKKECNSQAVESISQLKLIILSMKPTEIVAPASKSFDIVSIDYGTVYLVALFMWMFSSLLIVEYHRS